LPFVFIPVIICASMIDRFPAAFPRQLIWTIVIALTATTSLFLSLSDYQYARADKRVAADVKATYKDQRVFFKGRLGYLYYMHAVGSIALPAAHTTPLSGDVLVRNCASNDDAALFKDTAALVPVDTFQYPLFSLRTLTGRAGFYGNDRLPFAWVSQPAKRIFFVYRYK